MKSYSDLTTSNKIYAETFTDGDLTSQALGELAILTCMDTRINPLAILGLRIGEAKILRNAGGRITDDVIRSLVLAKSFLGVKKIIIMHHTDCALAYTTNHEIYERLSGELRELVGTRDFLPMENPDNSLSEDVKSLATNPIFTDMVIEGWRYDVRTGKAAQLYG